MRTSLERLRRAEEILSYLTPLAEGERSREMVRLCGADDELTAEVASLLDHVARMGDFLEESALGGDFNLLPATASAVAEPDEMIGRTVGRYRIERRIASGGMGTIYLAARADQQFTQRVALKIVKRGMDTDEILQRFRRERQTLAALEHPNIARLIDGGAAEGGQPYLVMEFVEGEPIDAYCDRLRLNVDARLELFLDVCDAVRHAHQNLVVHRDLKPSNILVTRDGTPKLLDFGIATVLDAEDARDATQARDRRLTPEYASPEQVAGGPVTTTSDVYSLGVILCELLSGRPPYSFATRTTADIQRVVATSEPSVPSTLARLAEPPGAALAAAAARSSTPEKLARRLRGDLDTIVLAALRKDPARRYPSAERLAGDIRQHLRRLPVSARRDTLTYRVGKFLRRHALATALAGIAFASLVAGGAAFAWQARAAGQERDRALIARAQSEAITSFLQHMLEAADPSREGPTVTVRALLEDSARRLDAELGEQPLVQASLRGTIGRTYLSLGLYREAEAQLRSAAGQRRELLGADHPDVAESERDLGAALYALNGFEEADLLLQHAAHIFRNASEPRTADLATALSSLGAVKRAKGELEEAESLQREALEIRRRASGEDSLEAAQSLNNLAGVLGDRGRFEEAQAMLEEALRIRRARLGEEHPLVAQSLDNLAVMLHRQGNLDGAEPLYLEALELESRVLGEDHPDVAVTRRNLAALFIARRKLPEAEDQLRRCLAVREKSLSGADFRTVTTMVDLADVLAAERKTEEAEELIEAALDATKDLAPDDATRLTVLARVASHFDLRGLPERAAEFRKQLPED